MSEIRPSAPGALPASESPESILVNLFDRVLDNWTAEVAVLREDRAALLAVVRVLVDVCDSGNVDAMHAICSDGSSVIAAARAAIARAESREV